MWEQFFSPTNRYCEMLRRRASDSDAKVDYFSEMELCVPPADLLKSRRSVHDFYSFVQNHVVVWMSPEVFITTSMTRNQQGEPILMGACIHPDMHHGLTIGSRSSFSVFASAYAPGVAACDFLLSFLAKSKVPKVSLQCSFNTLSTLPVSYQALSHFMGQESLAELELCHVSLDENFGHALSGVRGTSNNFNLTLECCTVHHSVCEGEALTILIHGLQSLTGALEVNGCWIDSCIIAATLSGDNCQLKKLKLTTAPSNNNSITNGGGGGQQRPIIRMDLIARSIQANNMGLVELVFGCMPISDLDLAMLCIALASHATVTTLDLSQAQSATATETSIWPQTFWLQRIVELIKTNAVL
jgi:hypothetical protein